VELAEETSGKFPDPNSPMTNDQCPKKDGPSFGHWSLVIGELGFEWVVTQDQFTTAIVGGKANNLNGLRGRLSDWIHLPPGLALPFGALERTLQAEGNREVREKVDTLVATAAEDPAGVLARVRALVLEMVAPADLLGAKLARHSSRLGIQVERARLPLAPRPWHSP
jgi:hypothetical protein